MRLDIRVASQFLSYRAIDMQGLIGLIGGYVGLVVGCSFLQLPNMISSLVINFSKRSKENRMKEMDSQLQ